MLLYSLFAKNNGEEYAKPFRFHFWTNYPKFIEVVQQSWMEDVQGNPFYRVHKKLKILKKVLITWTRKTYGNFFRNIATLEDIARVKETQLDITPL